MTTPIMIEAFKIEGFRAYLQPQTLNLCRGKTTLSLAVFAPNAKGKSSLVDALEYYFSEEATLSRLGKRQAQTHAGPLAMEHVDAEERGFTPAVHLWFRQNKENFDEVRPVSRSTRSAPPLPNAAIRVLSHTKIPFIIRGHELRSFVDKDTPEERYKDIVSWFALDPLLSIQQNLRTLRREIKKKVESKIEEKERLRDLNKITTGKIATWDEDEACNWFNTSVIAYLDKKLSLAKFSEEDAGYKELIRRKAAEDERLGLGTLKLLTAHLEALFAPTAREGEKSKGKILIFEKAVSDYSAAVVCEAEERSKASQAVFNDLWTAAKRVLEDKRIDLENCPVCETAFTSTSLGSRRKVLLGLEAKLTELSTYCAAEKNLKTNAKALEEALRDLKASLETAISSLNNAGFDQKTKRIILYLQNLKSWETIDIAPSSAEVVKELNELLASVDAERERIEKQQGECTYANALKIADALIQTKKHLKRLQRTKAELQVLHEELNRQALIINKAIVEHTKNLIGELQKSVDDLYRDIQGEIGCAPPIRFELPGEDDTNQQRVQLLIDFAENRKGVIPSGYLSDSQIHTLALSLRLSAIHMFNQGFPIIVLDDVVTSYDADHRKNIAAVLAKQFTDFQIIIVTHDEQFFKLLQDHLPPATWLFRRIIKLEQEFGPKFHDHLTPDEAIQAKLDDNQSVAAEIRQSEEEWLLEICRGFGAKIVIRPVDRPYQYERSELADALASFLKGAGLLPPEVPGISNSFLSSLQKGVIENFSSHFSDNPYKMTSIGDEKARWREFNLFRDQFACSACGNRRFKRPPSFKKPVCAKCETPFEFTQPQETKNCSQ